MMTSGRVATAADANTPRAIQHSIFDVVCRVRKRFSTPRRLLSSPSGVPIRKDVARLPKTPRCSSISTHLSQGRSQAPGWRMQTRQGPAPCSAASQASTDCRPTSNANHKCQHTLPSGPKGWRSRQSHHCHTRMPVCWARAPAGGTRSSQTKSGAQRLRAEPVTNRSGRSEQQNKGKGGQLVQKAVRQACLPCQWGLFVCSPTVPGTRLLPPLPPAVCTCVLALPPHSGSCQGSDHHDPHTQHPARIRHINRRCKVSNILREGGGC